MKDIIDEGVSASNKIQDKLTSRLKLRTVLYSIVMLIGGLIYAPSLAVPYRLHFIKSALPFILFCMIISLVLELIRLLFRKIKEKRRGKKIVTDPFWFLIFEGGFSIWLLFIFTTIILKYL